MKKVYVLISAACVAASASAVEKEMAVAKSQLSGAPIVKESVAPKTLSKVKADVAVDKMKAKATRAAGDYLYFRAADNVMAIGTSVNGYSYKKTFGFASSYGNLVFNNYSTAASGYEWIYTELNDYENVGGSPSWNYSSSEETNLSIKSGIGEILPPELTVEGASLIDENMAEYVCGGGATFWGFEDSLGGEFGLTFYQNPGYTVAGGYSGSLTYMTNYAPGEKGYNAAGVFVDSKAVGGGRSWIDVLGRNGEVIEDVKMDNFTFILPAPASTYFMTKAWIQLNVVANAATQLTSYIYPLDEDGFIEEMPIAIGYASIAKGEENYEPIFYYYPLDEDGNEVEGEVFINTSIAITVEGFVGNDAIKAVSPVSGYYPFSYEAYAAGNYDLCRESMTYISMSYKADGELVSSLVSDPGLYYIDQTGKDDDTLSALTYGKVTMDAVYPYIMEEEGVDSVTLPEEGGSATVTLSAFYYNIPELIEEGYYVVSAPEWIDVKIGALNQANQTTPMTVSVEASAEGRTGVVTIEGIGAKYSLTVNQGEGNAVSVIAIEEDAQYFDLQGRRVANPEKGIFIKKSGNKAEKVIF